MTKREARSTEPKHPIQVVARRTGLSADVLRVWEKRYRAVEPGRSETRRRLYSDEDVERLLLLRRATLGGRRIGQVAPLSTDELHALVTADEAAAAAAPRPAVSQGGTARPRSREGQQGSHLAECLEAARSLDARRLEAALAGASVALSTPALVDDVLTPLLRTIGDEWSRGKARVFQEHLTTALVRSMLGALRVAHAPVSGAPEIVVTTPAGQLHELGAMMAAIVAASEGWRVTYLGPSLPAEEIAAAASQREARAVALSVIYPADDPALHDELARLRRLLPEEVEILVGGGGAAASEALLESAGVRKLDDLGDLRETLRGLRATG